MLHSLDRAEMSGKEMNEFMLLNAASALGGTWQPLEQVAAQPPKVTKEVQPVLKSLHLKLGKSLVIPCKTFNKVSTARLFRFDHQLLR